MDITEEKSTLVQILADIDPDLRRRIASPGHSELKDPTCIND